MLENSSTSVDAYAAIEPISVIGLVLGIFGFLQTSLFTYTAVVGLGKPDGPPNPPPPRHWRKPWQFSITTGLDGPIKNMCEPLRGGSALVLKRRIYDMSEKS